MVEPRGGDGGVMHLLSGLFPFNESIHPPHEAAQNEYLPNVPESYSQTAEPNWKFADIYPSL